MANQIEVRTRSTSLGFPYRQRRSLMGNATMAILQPVTFYRTFPAARHWLWAAVFVLVMVGWSTVRQEAQRQAAATPAAGGSFEVPGADVFPSDPGFGGGFAGIPGGLPPTVPTQGAPTASAAPDISATLMIALVAAGGIVLAWVIQALLLILVSMLRGFAPSFGRNLQIVVWASLPLGVMALLQLIYIAAGGQGGKMGLSLVLDRWAGFGALPMFTQAALVSLLTQFTLFWLWSLILLYMGARHALDGSPTAAMLVVVFWLLIAVFVPVLTGAVTPPEAAAADEATVPLSFSQPDGDFLDDAFTMPEGARAPAIEGIPNIRPSGAGG